MTTASITVKVLYYHTSIASYRRWRLKGVGQLRIRLLVLDGRSAKLAGGLPSGPILSRLRRTPPVSLFSKLDQRHTGRWRKLDNLQSGGGEGYGMDQNRMTARNFGPL